MNNWYKQKAFFLILISFFFSKSTEITASKNSDPLGLNSPRLPDSTDSNDSELSTQFVSQTLPHGQNHLERQRHSISLFNNSRLPSNNIIETFKVDNWFAQQKNSCQNINSAYQEVYSFQTDNYYISICQLAESFYYRRQSKFDESSILLIPAREISYGGGFQATSKGTTYSVGRDGDRYYSSVMQNDNKIVFEPELSPESDAVLAKDLAEVNSLLPAEGVKVDMATNASLSDRSENNLNTQQALICLGVGTSNSRLHNWQQLLGESLDTASQYALNNGYSFVYDAQTPEQASIATSAAIVDLNVAVDSDTIDRVCIRPIAEN